MPNQAEEIVRDVLEAWNARDLPRFLSFLTDDVEWYDLGMPHPPARGRDAVQKFSEVVLRAFPDFTYTLQLPICVAPDGSRCAVLWKIDATHSGLFDPPGFAPTGRHASFEGVDILDFRGPRICRIRTLFDLVEAGSQLVGMRLRPDPGSFRERCAVRAQRVLAAWLRRRPLMRAS
jgi:predicted ester cyclase